MNDQNPAELPVEMPPESVESVNEPPVYQQHTPIFPIIAVIFTVLVMGFIAFAVLSTGKKQSANKKQGPSATPVAAGYKSISPTPATPSAEPTPILVSIPNSYLPLILEVLTYGEKAKRIKREFVVDLKLTPGDTLAVIKSAELATTGTPQGSNDSPDVGLRVMHGQSYLDIIPTFEGAGFGLPKKITSTAVKSKLETARLLRRLNLSELVSGFTPATKGFVYTTQYEEGGENCSAFAQNGTKVPACINSGLDVEPKDSGFFSLTCKTDSTDPTWCDTIVGSLTFSNNDSSSSAGQ